MAIFLQLKQWPANHPLPPILGAFVQAQIATQRDEPNSSGFFFPDGRKGRLWLASTTRITPNLTVPIRTGRPATTRLARNIPRAAAIRKVKGHGW
jgi:hypothetical protein